jgi:single-strand DNA-binding protein
MSAYNNQVTLIGRVAREAVLKDTDAGTVANFALAVYRSGKGDMAVTDFISINCWHDLARGMENINKGDTLIISGSINTRSYEKDGEKKYVTEVLAREIGLDISVRKEESEADPF